MGQKSCCCRKYNVQVIKAASTRGRENHSFLFNSSLSGVSAYLVLIQKILKNNKKNQKILTFRASFAVKYLIRKFILLEVYFSSLKKTHDFIKLQNLMASSLLWPRLGLRFWTKTCFLSPFCYTIPFG